MHPRSFNKQNEEFILLFLYSQMVHQFSCAKYATCSLPVNLCCCLMLLRLTPMKEVILILSL